MIDDDADADADADVSRMVDDRQLAVIDPADVTAVALSDASDRQFSGIVDTLHAGYAGDSDQLAFIDDTMRDFGRSINNLIAQQFTAGPHADFHAGPRFLYKTSGQP
jgi:hypothetical protein